MQPIGKLLIITGIIITITGIIIWLFSCRLDWFGNLPGDIKIRRDNFTFYAPLATFLLISFFLTIAVNLFRRFF